MLSSCARFATRKSAGVAAKTPSNRPSKISSSLSASNSANKSLYTSKRFYAGHHHHEEAPKPYKRTTLAARPADSLNSSEEREREVQGIEGWIFGRKVAYIDPLKPIPNTEAQSKANGWMWNKRPLAEGQTAAWEDWEPITYIGTAIFAAMVIFGLWSRTDNNIQTWAAEEARERRIIKARRELEESQAEAL